MTHEIEKAPSSELDIQPKENQVAILDAGAQYGKVIDRRVRGLMVESKIMPLDTPYEELEGYGALILSGGPESVYDQDAPKPDPKIWESGKPMLGICYGMQLINQAYGGSVSRKTTREDGQFSTEIDTSSAFFEGMEVEQEVLMSHGDSIEEVAPGFRVTATSGEIVAAIADEERKIYGVQFHPEVDLTKNGKVMLGNFLFEVADLESDYTLEDRLESAIDYIRETVGNRQVLTFASGGVDSTVCSVLVGKALPPEQITAVHVDTGFMRREESATVQEALKTVDVEVKIINAEEQFYAATTKIHGVETPPLRGVTDPEVKRAIIGDTFMQVMDRVIADLDLDPDNTVLAQGTLRPDLIESASQLASSKATVIKTHHNDTELVRKLRDAGRVIEPLQELHKDEVRELGAMLDLPDELVWRQPFPGPGLAIRLLCAEQPYLTDKFEGISEALAGFGDEDIAAHLLPVRTVGVQGDGRSYSYLAALSGTPDWARLMDKAREIPKELHDVNRVVYVFGDRLEEQPRDITPTFPEPEAMQQLRDADAHVNEVIRKYDLNEKLSQVPVVSFPVNFGKPGERSIGIRTFITNDFMTGVPAIPEIHMPKAALEEMVERVLSLSGISRVAYDLTSKPPGTTEWE
jgi:GMP synthase (glutamine-hydrolysing)